MTGRILSMIAEGSFTPGLSMLLAGMAILLGAVTGSIVLMATAKGQKRKLEKRMEEKY